MANKPYEIMHNNFRFQHSNYCQNCFLLNTKSYSTIKCVCILV